MRRFLGKRGFAVVTSLALCASLVVPSFAASFTELQNAVSNGTSSDGIEVTVSDDGVRNITLNDDVSRSEGGDNAIQITGSSNIVLDLNGHTVDGNMGDGATGAPRVAFYVENSTLTVTDSSEAQTGTITVNHANGIVRVAGNSQFTLNGGTISGNQEGAGVRVEGGNASFTMNGGAVSDNKGHSGVRVEGGTFTMSGGAISGNTISEGSAGGGGVYVFNNGTFNMSGGAISGNEATLGSGGGVGIKGPKSSFTMSGGTISGNTVKNDGGGGGGGGVWVKNQAQFTMEGGTITDNTVEVKDGVTADNDKGNGGGVAIHQAKFTMEGGTIYGNHSTYGTGVLVNAVGGDATFDMSGGYVKGEDGKSCIFLEESGNNNAVFNLRGDAIMVGTIHLGEGTEIHTNNVSQNSAEADRPHTLTGFTSNGESVVNSDTTDNEGYTAEKTIELDTEYNCVYNGPYADNGNDTHSPTCPICHTPDPENAQPHNMPHDWSDWSASSDGENHTRTHTCSDCGAVETDTQPHSWSWTDSKDGKTHTRTCSVCGYEASAPHSWGEWSDNGNGEHIHTCRAEGCDATETKSHDCNSWTDNKDGTHVATCTVCNTLVSQAHGEGGNWSDWSDTKDGANHIHSKTCPACGAVVATETGEHSWGDGVLSDDGTRRIYTCLDCGANKEEPNKGSMPNPGGTTDPEDPEKPTQPETPEQPTEPEEPSTPAEPEEPVTPENPDEPETPDEPAGPSDEEGPAVPSEPPEEPGDVVIDDPEIPLGPAPDLGEPDDEIELDEIELEDDVIPLSGLFTRADAIGYLWEKAGSPEAELSDFEDVPEEHQWAVAIGWAQKMGIALADEDGNFRPDDLLLRSVEDLEIDPEGEFQQFLDHYAVYADAAKPGETFLKLEGEVDDIIMGEEAQVIFDEFFLLLEEEAA